MRFVWLAHLQKARWASWRSTLRMKNHAWVDLPSLQARTCRAATMHKLHRDSVVSDVALVRTGLYFFRSPRLSNIGKGLHRYSASILTQHKRTRHLACKKWHMLMPNKARQIRTSPVGQKTSINQDRQRNQDNDTSS